MARPKQTITAPQQHTQGLLSAADMQQAITMATHNLLHQPLHSRYSRADNDTALAQAPGYGADAKTIEEAAEAAMAASIAQALQLHAGAITDAVQCAKEKTQNDWCALMGTCWQDLWPATSGVTAPCTRKNLKMQMEERLEDAAYEVLFPRFTIPLHEKTAMYEKALKTAFDASYRGKKLKDNPLMEDGPLIEVIETAFHHMASDYFKSAQERTVRAAPRQVHRAGPNLTYEGAREKAHAITQAIRKTRNLPEPHEPQPDIYDIYAELEARIGTIKAGELGEALCLRFEQSVNHALDTYISRHRLNVPFYHHGHTPQLG